MLQQHFNQRLRPDWAGELRLDYHDFGMWRDDLLFLRERLGWTLQRNDDPSFPPKIGIVGYSPEDDGRVRHVSLTLPVMTVQAYWNLNGLRIDANSLRGFDLIDYLMRVPKQPTSATRYDRLLGNASPVTDDDT